MTRRSPLILLLLISMTSLSAITLPAAPLTGATKEIALENLSHWTRDPDNPIFTGTSFAGDPQVWQESPGNYRMVYTDDADDRQAIAMATSTDLVRWTLIANSEFPNGVVLQGPGPGGLDANLETAFYRRTSDGKHQIFYIGYTGEATYHAAIYKAEADDIDGPYTREQEPVIDFTPGGPDAQAMTSPAIAEDAGTLSMTYVGWETYPDGPVSIMGATSTDDGRTWEKIGPLSWNDIFGVEADTTKGPDGLFYRVGITSDDQGGDVITLGRAEHPFGPYTELPEPILIPGGPSVGEGDTIMSPSLIFLDDVGAAYLYYSAVDTGGWPWVVSLATCIFQPK